MIWCICILLHWCYRLLVDHHSRLSKLWISPGPITMGLGVRLNLSQLWYLLCNSQLYSPLRYCYNARYLPDWSIGSRADRGQGLIPLRDLPYRFVQLLSVESGSLLVRHSCRIQRLRDKQASRNFGFLLRVAVEPLWKLKTQYNENYCWPNQYINWISRIPGSATVQTLSRALYMRTSLWGQQTPKTTRSVSELQ